ncbi:MAG TPA: DUF1822 family protein [Chroococcidiopsis sp.]
MINPAISFNELADWDAIADDTIELSDEQCDRAIQLSQAASNRFQQWSLYIQALALTGFEQWLEEWAPDLPLDVSHCSLYQPHYANWLDAVCNLGIGDFQLSLIPVGSVSDRVVSVPRAIVDLPRFVPHFYTLVAVQEEDLQVQIQGYLRHDQLTQYQQAQPLTADRQWGYRVPLEWFTPDPTALLLDLRALDGAAIPRPTELAETALALEPSATIQAQLTPQLPQLCDPDCTLQQVLPWSTGAAIINNPELAEWLYQQQQAETSPSALSAASSVNTANTVDNTTPSDRPQTAPADPLQPLITQAVNVGLWLRDQLDATAEALSWVLLPPQPAIASALRSGVEELDAVIDALRQQDIDIPDHAGGASRDIRWGRVAVRLYALTWVLPRTIEIDGWILLLALGPQPGTQMPVGISLQVHDSRELLVERRLTDAAQDAYLYAQVGGSWDEQFMVTINMANGAAVSLSFTFASESS